MNRYQSPVQNNLETYVPIPLDDINKAGAAIQGRYDQNEYAEQQAASTLASMKASDPSQQAVITQMANDFRSQSSDILDKYQHRYDDPGYKRDEQGLLMKFSNDPRYAQMKSTNDFLAEQQKAREKEDEAGHIVYDPNQNFKGVNPDGSFKVPTQGISRLNYVDDLYKHTANLGFDTDANGTESNIKQKHDYLNSMDSSEYNGYLKQAIQHQNMLGVTGEQATKNANQEIQNIVMRGAYTKQNPSAQLERQKYNDNPGDDGTATSTAKQGKVLTGLNAPRYIKNADSERFNSGEDYKKDGFWSGPEIRPKKLQVMELGHSSRQQESSAEGLHITGKMWTTGLGNGSNLAPDERSITLGDGARKIGSKVVGVFIDGKDKSGKLVAIGKDKDEDGDWGTLAADKIEKEKSTGALFARDSKGNKHYIQEQAVTEYYDPATKNTYRVAEDKNQTEMEYGANLSTDSIESHIEDFKAMGPQKFKEQLVHFGMDEQQAVNIANNYTRNPALQASFDRQIENARNRDIIYQRRVNEFGKQKTLTNIDNSIKI